MNTFMFFSQCVLVFSFWRLDRAAPLLLCCLPWCAAGILVGARAVHYVVSLHVFPLWARRRPQHRRHSHKPGASASGHGQEDPRQAGCKKATTKATFRRRTATTVAATTTPRFGSVAAVAAAPATTAGCIGIISDHATAAAVNDARGCCGIRN
jgi:hypothetical protein